MHATECIVYKLIIHFLIRVHFLVCLYDHFKHWNEDKNESLEVVNFGIVTRSFEGHLHFRHIILQIT